MIDHNNWYQSHAPNLVVCVVLFDPPGRKKAQYTPIKLVELSSLAAVLLLHIRRPVINAVKKSYRLQSCFT